MRVIPSICNPQPTAGEASTLARWLLTAAESIEPNLHSNAHERNTIMTGFETNPEHLDYAGGIRLQWLIFRDTVLDLAPYLDLQGLHHAIEQVRPSRVSVDNTAQGPWAHLVNEPALDDQRQELLYHLVDLAEQKLGSPWPILDDLRPATPDDASELLEND
jgi:hypothetical protein